MKNFNFLKRVLWLLIPLLTLFNTSAWGLVASEVADTKATSITDGDKFIIATAKTSGYYLTSTVTSNWGVCTTTLGSATIYTAHGTGSSFYLTCDAGTLVPNNSGNFLAYNSGTTANLKLSGSGDILNKSSDTYKLRRNTGSPGGGRWYTGSTGTAMYLFKVTITPKKVTYNAGSGTCKSSDTELVGGEGLTLASASPSASCASAGWVFAGWKQTSAQTETTSIPTLIPGGSTYYPATDETLYAVYRLGAVYAIDFESTAGTYTDWTFSSITSQGTNGNVIPHGGTKIGLTANSNGNYASVKTKTKIAAPKAIKFYISKVSTNTTASTWQVYTSTDGSTWTSRKSQDAKSMNQGVWVEVSQDLSSYTNVYVKVEYGTSNAVRCIDDLILSCATYNSNPSCCTSLGSINGSILWTAYFIAHKPFCRACLAAL